MKEELTDSLIQSSIALQKKTAELLETILKLNKRIDKLLDVFESAAKAIEKGEVEEPLAKKLEVLLDQNKNIARGLMLLERYVKDKSLGFTPSFPPKALPKTEI
ncbi:MAG TPA: hypothetical protein VJB94_05240 [Candidatus Nanoarchaeia archaeon]|nr:hypothetical protein [Candidatus Nanoarchaeia archaeon]